MVSNLDIWRATNLLTREHGAGADLEAARLQDLMLDRDDDEGRLVWAARIRRNRRVADAAIGQAQLKQRGASVVLEAWDRLLDLAIETWLWVLDQLAPLPVSIVR
jgi:hypothetical protein